MQTIAESWTRYSDRPDEIHYSKKIEVTAFWHNGKWVSGEGLCQLIGDEAANRIIELHRQIREAAERALRLHEWVLENERRTAALADQKSAFDTPRGHCKKVTAAYARTERTANSLPGRAG